MNAREEILARVSAALVDVVQPDPSLDVPVRWEFGQPTSMPSVVDRFIEACQDYRAEVVRVPAIELPSCLAELVFANRIGSLVVPPGLDESWRQAVVGTGAVVQGDDPMLTSAELDQLEAVLTAAAVGIAETGTIVLDHGSDQGRRALTLVPDTHLVVVRVDQLVSDVPEAVARLAPAVNAGAPLTWISGPSATSDIELSRVEGVHGPRKLIVILAA